MAPPPPGSLSGNQSTASGEAQRSIPTPFLTKTYQIVDDPAIDDVISWNEDGSAFVVWNPTVFARDLLPKYFKHNNLSSFVRQLNTYGFRKVAPERWEFGNESFRRGEKRLLCEIQRKNVPMRQQVTAEVSPAGSIDEQVISNSPPLVIPSASVCSNNNGRVDLGEQNEQLRKENEQLNRELLSMKALCSNIFALMSDYANRHIRNSDGGGGISMETEDPYAQSPTRLFGFEIGTKRKRDSGGSMHLDDPIEVDFKVKSEPFDDGGVHQQVPWIRRCHRHEDKICNS